MTLPQLRDGHPWLVRTLYALALIAWGVLVLEQIDALAAMYWVVHERDVVALSATDWAYLRWAPALSVLASVLCAWVFLAGALSEVKTRVPGWALLLGALCLGAWPLGTWLFFRIVDILPPSAL